MDSGVGVSNRPVYSAHLYDEEETLGADGLRRTLMNVAPYDVIAIHVAETPPQVASVNIDLGMLRPPLVKTKGHTTMSALEQGENNLVPTQVF